MVSVHSHLLDTDNETLQTDVLSHVKVLQRMGKSTVLVYFPSTSQLRRHEFSARLAYEILQFMPPNTASRPTSNITNKLS